VTAQRIESLCRSALDPCVPVDVGRAEHPDGRRAVWVIRMPSDFSGKPVFVDGNGVLSRIGEATVPAPVSQIRDWLLEDEPARAADRVSALRSRLPDGRSTWTSSRGAACWAIRPGSRRGRRQVYELGSRRFSPAVLRHGLRAALADLWPDDLPA
jgi:hypothetical protein